MGNEGLDLSRHGCDGLLEGDILGLNGLKVGAVVGVLGCDSDQSVQGVDVGVIQLVILNVAQVERKSAVTRVAEDFVKAKEEGPNISDNLTRDKGRSGRTPGVWGVHDGGVGGFREKGVVLSLGKFFPKVVIF